FGVVWAVRDDSEGGEGRNARDVREGAIVPRRAVPGKGAPRDAYASEQPEMGRSENCLTCARAGVGGDGLAAVGGDLKLRESAIELRRNASWRNRTGSACRAERYHGRGNPKI